MIRPLPLGPLNRAQRATTALEQHLRTSPAADRRVRNTALGAVNAMMNDAARSAQLLTAARIEAARSFDPANGRAAALAREAYEARTSAEVGKYRAAYALMAEEESNKAAELRNAALRVKSAKEHTPLMSQVRYHEKRRDLMLAAAAATTKALNQIPPLPAHVTKRAAALPSTRELLASPTLGWRPPKLSNLTGNFFPDDVRAAAGGLGAVESAEVPQSSPAWWASLQNAIGFGVKAAGQAASEEGEKTATSNPTGGGALTLGGSLLDKLSAMIGGAGGGGAPQAPLVADGPNWGTILLVGGGLSIGGYLLFKLFKGKS